MLLVDYRDSQYRVLYSTEYSTAPMALNPVRKKKLFGRPDVAALEYSVAKNNRCKRGVVSILLPLKTNRHDNDLTPADHLLFAAFESILPLKKDTISILPGAASVASPEDNSSISINRAVLPGTFVQ